MLNLATSLSSIAQPADPNQRWISIGPRPITGFTDWGAVSGRVRAVAVDPTDANHWLIASASGGVWDTPDAGAHWVPRTDDQATLAMGAIAIAPSDATIVYAGTGEENQSEGAGLLKSTDGGIHWELLAADTFVHTACTVLRVDPSNPSIVLAGTTAGRIGAGTEETEYWQYLTSTPMGILRSTDGALTWSLTLVGQATDLAVDPGDFSRQYAALGGTFGTITNGPLVSTNGLYRSLDGGQTWTPVAGPWDSLPLPVGRVQLAIAPSNPNVLFVSIAVAWPPFALDESVGGTSLGLWRTANAWAATPAWTQLPDPGEVGDQLWYNHTLAVDPTNPNVLFFGAETLKKFTGATWQALPEVIHVDQQCMAWAQGRLIVGNDGGLYSTPDRGTTWNNHNAELAITQFYFGSLHPLNRRSLIAGSQDNGFETWIGANAWTAIAGADGIFGIHSPSQPDKHFAALIQYGWVFRNLNGPGEATATLETSGLDLTDANFLCPMVMHPGNENLLLLGTDRVWKCTNFFSAPRAIWHGNSPVRSGTPSQRGSVTALAFAPSDPTGNTYAYGNRFGELRLTTDGGANWQNLDAGNAVPDRELTALAFDPADANVFYVTLSGLDEDTPGQPGHFFKTANALSGTPAWVDISPPENVRHRCIALDVARPDALYVGTDRGVWTTTDGGSFWRHLGPDTGMPNVLVLDLKIQPATGRLFAFTYGRGAYALVPLPVLDRPQWLAEGGAEISLQVNPNDSYIVEGSTNLVDWARVSSFNATNSTMTVTDPASAAGPRRYYRARLLFP